MNRALSSFVAAAAVCLTVFAASCSAGDGAGTQPSEAGPANSSQPTTSTAASPSAETNDGDKPSKSDVVAGLTKFYENDQNLAADKAKKFAECMVDEMYDKARAKTLMAMMHGTATEADPADAGLIAQSGMACAKVLN